MKTIIERSDLLKALNHVQSVVERRNTIPILSNVLLEADNGVLGLTATDLEIEMRERVDAEVVQPGAITAPPICCMTLSANCRMARKWNWPPMRAARG